MYRRNELWIKENTLQSKNFGKYIFTGKVAQKLLGNKLYAMILDKIPLENWQEKDKQRYCKILIKWAQKLGAKWYSHLFFAMDGRWVEKRQLLQRKICSTQFFKGEVDASSLPTGATVCNAKGIVLADISSPPFVLDGCLYLPCSLHFEGHCADICTPQRNSCLALEKQILRVSKALGISCDKAQVMAGCEQEFFLFEENLFLSRPDLKQLNTTVLCTKVQLEQRKYAHYMTYLRTKVQNFANDVAMQLWELGIICLAFHAEGAPCQYEIVTKYDRAEQCHLHNQIVTRILQQTAQKYNLKCVFSEKPLDGFSGSGKHLNWSVQTNVGNLLQGGNIHQTTLFIATLLAVTIGVHCHQDLLKSSISSLQNDKRLGQCEAPSKVISICLGQEITSLLTSLCNDDFTLGKHSFIANNCQRNRTSPIAYNGNKLELRNVGANSPTAISITLFNTIVTEGFDTLAKELENTSNATEKLQQLAKNVLSHHKNILFDGNCYSAEWKLQSKARGLSQTTFTPKLLQEIGKAQILQKHAVMDKYQAVCLQKTLTERYFDEVRWQTTTALDMFYNYLLPSANTYAQQLDNSNNSVCQQLSSKLWHHLEHCHAIANYIERYLYGKNSWQKVSTLLQNTTLLNYHTQAIESLLPQDMRPYPTYLDLIWE